LLTNRYLEGIPEDSRAAKSWGYLQKDQVAPVIMKVKELNKIARERLQSLAQMAIAWLLKDHRVTSILIGASSVDQLKDNLDSRNNLFFDETELRKIEEILKS
jgi:L-glyceraldehyde 3-phosphate reductase